MVYTAITGFDKMMPIAGEQEGAGIIEGLLSFLLVSLTLCMLTDCFIVLIGFYKHMKQV